jgi:hypothetical protein
MGVADIAHELFHLKLIAEGFPFYSFQPPPDVDQTMFMFAAGALTDVLEHRLFFPQMRSMGLDPTTKQRRDLELIMHQDDKGWNNPIYAAIHYLEHALQDNNDALVEKIDGWYRRRGWTQALDLGKKMKALILLHNPRTARQIQWELRACLNLLFGNKVNPDMIKPVPVPIHPPSHPIAIKPVE